MIRAGSVIILVAVLLVSLPACLVASDTADADAALIKEILSDLVKSLFGRGDKEQTGEVASWTPDGIGPVSEEMIPGLIAELKHKDYKVRGRAATALGLLGFQAKDAVPALREALKDKSGAVRASAAGAIWMITGESEEMCPILVKLLRGKTKAYHIYAAMALGAVGLPARIAIPELTKALATDKFPGVRVASAVALAKIGVTDDTVLQALERARSDEDKSVREAAEKVLGTLRSRPPKSPESRQPTVAECIARLADKDPKSRASAASYLARFGAGAADAVPALTRLLSDSDVSVRSAAAGTLGRVGPAAKPALPALAAVLKDESPAVRGRAATAIGALGAEARQYVPALREALDADTKSSRAGMAAAIWRITGESGEMLPVLAGLLADEDVIKRLNGAIGFARVGPAAKEAEPVLLKALTDEDAAVRAAAAFALASIGGAKPEVLAALEDDARKASVDLGERIRLGKTVSREFSGEAAPGEKTTSSAATGGPSPPAPQAPKETSLSGTITYEPSSTALRYGVESGPVGSISLAITTKDADQAHVEGKLDIRITEKPYYADSEVVHVISAAFSGEGSKSSDGKWKFTATARYTEKVEGAASYSNEGEAVVQFEVLPDNTAEGSVEGVGCWSPCRFKASAG